MLNLGILLIIILLAIFNLATAVNYCNPELCTNNGVTRHHVACNHNGKFASSCVRPYMVPITPRLREFILYYHNDYRNKVANGSLPGFASARRMGTLTWDNELQYLAELNVKQCKMEHDECHNTEAYRYSGQNIGYDSNTIPIPPEKHEDSILYLITAWFEEYKDATQRDVDLCSRDDRSFDIGHFTAMVQQKSTKVGCGVAKYTAFVPEEGENFDTLLLTCNYNYGNTVHFPIYVKGKMCSGCETGCNPKFPGLCSESENIPPVPYEEDTPIENLVPAHLLKYVQVGQSDATVLGHNIEKLITRPAYGTGTSIRNKPTSIETSRSPQFNIPSASGPAGPSYTRNVPASSQVPARSGSVLKLARDFQGVPIMRMAPQPSTGQYSRPVPLPQAPPELPKTPMPMSHAGPAVLVQLPRAPPELPKTPMPTSHAGHAGQDWRLVPLPRAAPELPKTPMPTGRVVYAGQDWRPAPVPQNIPILPRSQAQEPRALPRDPYVRAAESGRNYEPVASNRNIPTNESPQNEESNQSSYLSQVGSYCYNALRYLTSSWW